MGILEVLTIVFAVLKLLGVSGVATWSWLAVCYPLIVSVALYALLFVVAIIMLGMC